MLVQAGLGGVWGVPVSSGRGRPLRLVVFVGGKRACPLFRPPPGGDQQRARASRGHRGAGAARGRLPRPGSHLVSGAGAARAPRAARTRKRARARTRTRAGRRGGRRRAGGYRCLPPRRHLAATRGQWGRAAGWRRRRRRRGAEAGTSRPRPGPAQRVAPAGHGARGGDGRRAAEEAALVGLGGTHERAHQARLAGRHRHPRRGRGRRRRRRDRLLQETRDQELQRWVRGRPGPLSWQVRPARSLFTAAPAAPRPMPAAGPRRCHPARRRIGARGGCRRADNAFGLITLPAPCPWKGSRGHAWGSVRGGSGRRQRAESHLSVNAD